MAKGEEQLLQVILRLPHGNMCACTHVLVCKRAYVHVYYVSAHTEGEGERDK